MKKGLSIFRIRQTSLTSLKLMCGCIMKQIILTVKFKEKGEVALPFDYDTPKQQQYVKKKEMYYNKTGSKVLRKVLI
jgi:hypothetical protein